MKLYIEELEKVKNDGSTEYEVKSIIGIFLSAINDWPNSHLTLEDFEADIQKFIGSETKKNELENSLKKINFTTHAWQAESLTQVIQVYRFYSEKLSLNEIIEDLRKRLKK